MTSKMSMVGLTAASLFAAQFTATFTPAAQAAEPVANPLSAQIGVGLLTDSDARRATNNAGIHAGIGFQLSNPSLLSPVNGKPSIDLDYNSNTGHGNHVNVLGLSYTERVALGAPAESGGARPYVGLGIGAYHTDLRASVTTTTTTQTGGSSGTPGSTVTTTTTKTESKSKWNLGGKVLAGVEFGKTFVEASYIISGSTEGVRSDSANLAIGMHF